MLFLANILEALPYLALVLSGIFLCIVPAFLSD